MAALGGWRRVAGWAGWRRLARELVLVAVFLAVYEEIGWHMVQAGGAAAGHALSVVSAERALGLFHERAVQAVFTPWDSVTDAFNTYYGGTHFLVPAAILAWLVLRHPERYARARTALAVMTAVAFVCFWLYPVAPPRLLPSSFGFVDTLRTAIWLYTAAGGRLLREDDRVGTLAPGAFADIVGFRGDLMDHPVDDLPSRQPALTVVGGRAVHDHGALFG